MSRTDTIADMLTSIRNAGFSGKESVNVPASKIGQEILRILAREGYIKDYKFIKDNKQGILRVYLKFKKNNELAFINMKRISKPGLRIYTPKEDIPEVLGGLGIAILSTSKGLLTDKEAREANIGGEILCYVW